MESSHKNNLFNEECGDEDCLLAIRGQRIPQGLGEDITRLCIIRGIRYHPGFARELHGLLPEFTRALNARDIMSNEIPEMEKSEDFPYCIWYPETAAEETIRALAARYPQMKYLVGRACAVAGYVNMFHELDLLPESHIAEEARNNQQWGIYEAIMKPELRYNHGRLYADGIRQAEIKTKFAKPSDSDAEIGDLLSFRRRAYFDITEDDRVDKCDSKEPRSVKDAVSHLLYTPLPADLPTMDKDLLIQMAAYYGDTDRFSRLRRPHWAMTEILCVIRGIYHNTMFAKWWSLQPNRRGEIEKAINARFIMNNDLSRIKPETRHLPYCIWYPSVPHPSTCLELIRRAPSMEPAVARVCILADYPETWDKVDADPDVNLMRDARESHNLKYLRDLETKIKDRGCCEYSEHSINQIEPRHRMFEYTATCIDPNVADRPRIQYEGVPYNGKRVSMSHIEVSVAIPDDLKKWCQELWGQEREQLYLNEYYDYGGPRRLVQSGELPYRS